MGILLLKFRKKNILKYEYLEIYRKLLNVFNLNKIRLRSINFILLLAIINYYLERIKKMKRFAFYENEGIIKYVN